MPLRQRKGTAREDQASGRLPRPKGRMRTGAVPPAGIAENIAQLVGPTGSAPGIAKEIDPLVERNGRSRRLPGGPQARQQFTHKCGANKKTGRGAETISCKSFAYHIGLS